jgi:hypothetical protein
MQVLGHNGEVAHKPQVEVRIPRAVRIIPEPALTLVAPSLLRR